MPVHAEAWLDHVEHYPQDMSGRLGLLALTLVVTAGLTLMYYDVESSAACNGKEGESPLVEADCSLLSQAPAPENHEVDNVPEGLGEHLAEEVCCVYFISTQGGAILL